MEFGIVWYKSPLFWSSLVVLISSVTSLFTGVGVVMTGTELTMIVEGLVALASTVGLVVDRTVATQKKLAQTEDDVELEI